MFPLRTKRFSPLKACQGDISSPLSSLTLPINPDTSVLQISPPSTLPLWHYSCVRVLRTQPPILSP